jgi:hypothetical protein
LVNGATEIMLLVVDLHENFIDGKSISVTLVISFPSPCIFGAKLDTPEADRPVGSELVVKPLPGADTNHGSVFPKDSRPGERFYGL